MTDAVLRRAALVAAVLGSILTIVNQPEAVFHGAEFQLLPLAQVFLTPFVVVAISQLLGARQANIDSDRIWIGEAAPGTLAGPVTESFWSTVFSHGIPSRAVSLGFLCGGINTLAAMAAEILENGNLDDLPIRLLTQAFALPVAFGVLSQALAYRRTAKAFASR
jgi:hypothetical protein